MVMIVEGIDKSKQPVIGQISVEHSFQQLGFRKYMKDKYGIFISNIYSIRGGLSDADKITTTSYQNELFEALCNPKYYPRSSSNYATISFLRSQNMVGNYIMSK